MSYHLANGLGDSIDSPTPAEMREFLDNVDFSDHEHGAAWLTDDDDNSLEYSGSGTLVFSRGDLAPRHMVGVETDRLIALWIRLAEGRLPELESEPWQPGSHPPLPPGELERRQREMAEGQWRQDLEFYDALGPERADTACRNDGCPRGRIAQSAFCRVHHFESVTGRACPFQH
jgi:hypothetical protein